MNGFPIDIVVNEGGLPGPDPDRYETALDAQEFLPRLALFQGKASGVGVRGGTAAEFMKAGSGVDGVILPMAVAVDD